MDVIFTIVTILIFLGQLALAWAICRMLEASDPLVRPRRADASGPPSRPSGPR